MVYPDTFEGFMVNDQKDWTTFKKQEFKPKKFNSNDIDIKIECCGVCGSDVHSITGGWGEVPLPICVGHEVIGHAVKVGDKVTTVKVGDRVGCGAQVWSCLKCKQCKSDNENYCPHLVDTYGAPYPKSEDPEETVSQGGFASHIRVHEYFTFPIPEGIPSHEAAPMMCAGLTVYSPLVRLGAGPGKKVGIVGIGGLGHFAIMWAAALGCETYAISHSPDKKADALKLGAKEFISTKEKNWAEPYAFFFDFIINSADMTQEFNMTEYMSTLSIGGHFHQVGLPDEPLPQMKAQDFVANMASISGSHIGCRPEALAMLKLAADKGLHPMIETIPISAKGCSDSVQRLKKNDVRYRFTLVDFDKEFGSR